MPGLTEFQAQRALFFIENLRDKLAVEINQGAAVDVRELHAVCKFLNEIRPIVNPPLDGPPPGMMDRRGNVH